MKRITKGLKEDRLVYMFAVVGVFLIAFPTQLAQIAPLVIGIELILYSVASFIISIRYKDADVNPGKAFVYVILGAAIMHQESEAIGVIGSMWAMIALLEAADEINEMLRTKKYSVFHIVSIVLSTLLAIALLFAPFEHFVMHMQLLGVEMVLSIFERQHKKIPKEEPAEA